MWDSYLHSTSLSLLLLWVHVSLDKTLDSNCSNQVVTNRLSKLSTIQRMA
uniref:Uncharacterized protein n=1 Tax=Ciona intestinalis TaxID=7719 RepID=H2XN52_CIOIN